MAAPAPIALQQGEGEALWFLGSLLTIKAAGDTTAGRFTLIEHLAPQGAGSPLHMHEREDEWFYVLEGELAFWVDGKTISAPAGSFVFGPRGIPHTFSVVSKEARFLLVAEPSGFENFVRALAKPAATRTLPPPTDLPPDPQKMATIAAEYGIRVLGPPGIPG